MPSLKNILSDKKVRVNVSLWPVVRWVRRKLRKKERLVHLDRCLCGGEARAEHACADFISTDDPSESWSRCGVRVRCPRSCEGMETDIIEGAQDAAEAWNSLVSRKKEER